MSQLQLERKQTARRFSVRRTQRWIRRRVTGDNVMQSFRTLGWVVPLTILIWIYAERQQVGKEADVTLPIEVHIDNDLRVVTLVRPADKNVLVTLNGSQSSIDRFRNEIHGGSPLTIVIDPKSSTEQVQSIATASTLNATHLLQRYGITVSNCDPPELKVDVDILDSPDVPVQAPPDMSTIVGQPIFVPATVKLRGPHRAMPKNPVAYAELEGLDVLSKPGEHTISNVIIKPPTEDPRLAFVPTEVKATVTVREQDIPYTIPAVPVWGALDGDRIKRYTVNFFGRTTVPDVTVVGPPDKIKLLELNQLSPPPTATVVVLPGDDPGVRLSRKPRIDLPPNMGLRVANEDSIQPIQFELTDTQPQ